MTATHTHVGRAIRDRRNELGLTQFTVARAADISMGFLSDLENEKRDVSTGRLRRIAIALRTTAGSLLDGLVSRPPRDELAALEARVRRLEEIAGVSTDDGDVSPART